MRSFVGISALLTVISACCPMRAGRPTAVAQTDFHDWARTPPMGWNSWDAFAVTITEEQTKAQAAFMAQKLKAHGWQYIVIDAQWFEPGGRDFEYRKDAVLTMDGHGRLLPAPNRFPSSADGSGFKSLAAHLHGLGLKLGIHLMRGIPRQAVARNLPILGTGFHAQDIADKLHVCQWNPDMFGVDMSKPGAQAYYDSVFALIAEWGVDYVKVDDLSRPYFQNLPEVEAIRRAIDRTGRPIVLSLSPGATDIKAAEHVAAHANLWRISDDFWDRWQSLRDQFWRLDLWNRHRKPGAWPDADMLPLGTLALGKRQTRFTRDEQYTVMTLWSIARSPLMHGGDLTKTDDFTLSLLTNDEVLAVNQHSTGNRPLWDRDGLIAWAAVEPKSGDRYLALFNARDRIRIDESNARQPAIVLGGASGEHASIDVDLSGGAKLFLSAKISPEADVYWPVTWQSPRFLFADGSERPLSDYAWTGADAIWDSARMNPAKDGSPAELLAQAFAVIEYAIPADAVRFKATVRTVRPNNADPSLTVRILTVVGGEHNEDRRPAVPIEVALGEIGVAGEATLRDLWAGKDIGPRTGLFTVDVPFHGARLFRISPRISNR
jgi:alpha-galactosidase